jgi:hypothetical protein
MLRSCDSKSGVLPAAADQPNPMKPIPPERLEAILARLSGPAREKLIGEPIPARVIRSRIKKVAASRLASSPQPPEP